MDTNGIESLHAQQVVWDPGIREILLTLSFLQLIAAAGMIYCSVKALMIFRGMVNEDNLKNDRNKSDAAHKDQGTSQPQKGNRVFFKSLRAFFRFSGENN